ncbi:unnamed protein product [Prorocentrum cordatum]|uniref:Uncharacterized protein n=1 Tax=Prorocentrum cordatum TaxID=2364126 RepID=A0ABN9VVL6_9DINO|nr:unnamed protein product [Polarella glacialis]
MPAFSKEAVKTKTDNCRDRKRAASLNNWVAKPWVKQFLKEAAQKHLQKFHNTCATLRREKADLSKQVKTQRKELFVMRRDKFVAERAAENNRKAYERATTGKDKLDGVVEEAARLRQQLRKARAEGRAEGAAAAKREAAKEHNSLQNALWENKAKYNKLLSEKCRFLALATAAQRENYFELAKCHQITGHSSNIENTYLRLDEARMKYVLKKERTIRFGSVEEWSDIEADEVDLGKEDDWRKTDKQKPVQWEQWGGIVERGRPHALALTRFDPRRATRRAPGPGPIRKRDGSRPPGSIWRIPTWFCIPTAPAHTECATPGVIRDNVVHCKKKVVFKGKTVWVKPKYSEIKKHILPGRQHLSAKTGAQIIDRFWSHLRAHLGKRARKVNNVSMCRRIRSAQWTHWEKGQDLWVRAGEMLRALY